MKSYAFFIFFFFSVHNTYCQFNNVYVEYGVRISDDNGSFTKDKMFAETFLNAVKKADKLTFGLIINNKGSKFYEVNNGIEQDYQLQLAKVYANYTGIIYNFETNVIKESQLLGNNIYIKRPNVENWILTSETKLIDNYLCYKATNTYTVVNIKGTFKFPVTAWYCPKLPYKYGPSGYGNLPGLILELQVRNVNFGVKKLDIKSDLNFNDEFLKNAKLLTEEELNRKLDEFNNFDGK